MADRRESANSGRSTSFSSLGNLLDESDSSGDEELAEQNVQHTETGQAVMQQQDDLRQDIGSILTSSSSDSGVPQQTPEASSAGYTHDPLYGEPYGGYNASQAEADEDEQVGEQVSSVFNARYLHPHFDIESMSEDEHHEGYGDARSTTGLAVAGVVRKMRLNGSQMNWREGSIMLSPKALSSWLATRRRRSRPTVRPIASPVSADWARSPSTAMSEAAQVGGGIAEQMIRIRSESYGDQQYRGGSYDEPPVRSGSYDEEDRPRRGTSESGSYDEDRPRRSAAGSGSYDEGDIPRQSPTGSGSSDAGDRMRRSASGSGSYDEGDMPRRGGAFDGANRMRRGGPYDEGEKSRLPPSAAAVPSHASPPHTSSPQPEQSQIPSHASPQSGLDATPDATAVPSATSSQPHAHNATPTHPPTADTSSPSSSSDALPDTVGLYKWKVVDSRS